MDDGGRSPFGGAQRLAAADYRAPGQPSEGVFKATSVAQQVQALYAFVEGIGLADRLNRLAKTLDAQGDNREAQILSQLWEILLGAMEQLYDVLGETAWDSETFTRLFRLLISQYDVGTIPPVLDGVTAGPVSAMRCQESRHLILLGASEGSLPGYTGSTGILSDRECDALRSLGMPLTGGAMEGIQAEFGEIYGVFCGCRETMWVSCPGGQPSFVCRRLGELAGGMESPGEGLGAALTDPQEAAAYLAGRNGKTQAQDLGLTEDYNRVLQQLSFNLGTVKREQIQGLYGKSLNLSASQIDLQAQCRLAYFLKYGLKIRERKPAQVDPAEFGTYVHWVLEQTVNTVIDIRIVHEVSLEDTLEIAREAAESYGKTPLLPAGLTASAVSFPAERPGAFLDCPGAVGRTPSLGVCPGRHGGGLRRRRGFASGAGVRQRHGGTAARLCGPGGCVAGGPQPLFPGGGLQNRQKGL